MNFKVAGAILIICLAHSSIAQQVGDIVEKNVAVMDARGKRIYAYVPLPPGKWEVSDSGVRQSTGNTAADLRDVRLLQIESDVLKHAIDLNP